MTRQGLAGAGLLLAIVVLVGNAYLGFHASAGTNDALRQIRRVETQTRSLAVEARGMATQTQTLLEQGRHQRLIVTAAICRQTNALSDRLKALLIASVKSSAAFERTLRRLHLPPYRARLRAARREARSLDLVDCAALRRK